MEALVVVCYFLRPPHPCHFVCSNLLPWKPAKGTKIAMKNECVVHIMHLFLTS